MKTFLIAASLLLVPASGVLAQTGMGEAGLPPGSSTGAGMSVQQDSHGSTKPDRERTADSLEEQRHTQNSEPPSTERDSGNSRRTKRHAKKSEHGHGMKPGSPQ